MKKFAVFLSLFFFGATSFAAPKAYIETPRMFKPGQVSIDGNSYKLTGFPSTKIVDAFAANPEAMAFAKNYRSNQMWGSAIGIGVSVGALGYLFYELGQDPIDFTNDEFLGVLFAQLIGAMVAGIFQFKAKQRFVQAMNTYNGVGGDSGSDSARALPPILELAPATKGLGLALRF